MADINTAHTFVDGDIVHAADLNNIQDQATILEAFISGKPPVTPLTTDYVVVSSGGSLKKARVDAIPGVASVLLTSAIPGTSVSPAGPQTGPAVSLAITQTNQSGNTFLCSPPGGAAGSPSYRAIVPKDVVIPLVIVMAFNIDWTLGNYFYKAITGLPGNNFTMTGAVDGQSICVQVGQAVGNATITFPVGVRWENGAMPVLTPTVGKSDLFQFWFLGTALFGKRIVTNF